MNKKVIIKHNGKILEDYGFGNIFMDIDNLSSKNKEKIIKRIQFRNNELYDFEYGIGGFVSDEYYKIKSIKLQNNDIEVIVKVSKV